jgi:DNA-binding phage protein
MAKRKSRLGVAPFDASEYLDNREVIAEYLGAALEDGNTDVGLSGGLSRTWISYRSARRRMLSSGAA